MMTGPMRLYAPTFETLLTQRLDSIRLAAVLLDGRYQPDMRLHTTMADVTAFEIAGGTYSPANVNGARVDSVPGGCGFFTDAVLWPAPSDLRPARYMAFVRGAASALGPTDTLFGLVDLAPDGGAVEAQRGSLRISPSATGWFAFTTDSNPSDEVQA